MCDCNNSCGSNTESCSCNSELGGAIKYDGLGFECVNDAMEQLFALVPGASLNSVLELYANQICSILNGAGVTGATGANGSTWYSGIVIPVDYIGVVGDYYFNTATGDVFIKELGGWVFITNLSGINGANGTNGTSFRFGSGAPSIGYGNDGDSYQDLSSPTLKLYTNTANVWSDTGLNVKGTDGAAGTNGTNGTNGADGTDGLSFLQGVGVPSGGVDGDSYLDSGNGDLYYKASGVWAITGNIYSGPAGLEFLFNAEKITEQTISGASGRVQVTFSDDVSPGRFDYGNSWITDEQKMPADTDNLSYRGVFNLKVSGVDAVTNNDVTVTVYSDAVSVGTFTISVPAGTADTTIIPLNFQTVSAFYATDKIISVELSTGVGAEYLTFVGVLQIGSIFYNVQT